MSPRARRFHLRKSEVIAVLTHALSGATNWPPANTIFCPAIFDLSHRALQARGMCLSAPNFIDIQARLARLRRLWARFFEHGDVVLCPSAPPGPIRHDQNPDPRARSIVVNGKQRPHFDPMLWACLATGAVLRRRGSGDA